MVGMVALNQYFDLRNFCWYDTNMISIFYSVMYVLTLKVFLNEYHLE
jgi:hypothetical protein